MRAWGTVLYSTLLYFFHVVFSAARRLAPCLVVVENIDSIFGSEGGGEDDPSVPRLQTHRNRRTQHAALDRLLSCLLVQVDGIGSDPTDSGTPSDASRPVIVVATCQDPTVLDRCSARV